MFRASPIAEAPKHRRVVYSGTCANRNVLVRRAKHKTIIITDGGEEVRVGKCMCGLYVFMDHVNGRE